MSYVIASPLAIAKGEAISTPLVPLRLLRRPASGGLLAMTDDLKMEEKQ
ncbi:MAG: hypothetical protein HW414_154 [Dehalococcoidia bacterium]|nr:hypothetical protein [Dehalococcoidia bacterium]